MTPTARWALKIHASEMPTKTMVHSETFASVEGVRVASIWRTRRTRTMNWDREA
jgi:hypothetical protein